MMILHTYFFVICVNTYNFFVALFVLSLCPISVGIGPFVIGLGQISSFLSSYESRRTSIDFGIKRSRLTWKV